jgi:uncharacterized RDD family membrane protein YckC
LNDLYALETPEQVDLRYEVAGAGSRFIAAIIDFTIVSLISFAFFLVIVASNALLSKLGATWLAEPYVGFVSFLVVASFLFFWGYFILLELAWNGQTVGKRIAGLRVITADGRPVGVYQVFIRNLLRPVDFLPVSYMAGVASILLTARCQRLGDLAAGTIVVKERPARLPTTLQPSTGAILPPQAVASFGPEQVRLARDFMLRADSLEADQRARLAARLAGWLRPRLGAGVASLSDDLSDEALIAQVASINR